MWKAYIGGPWSRLAWVKNARLYPKNKSKKVGDVAQVVGSLISKKEAVFPKFTHTHTHTHTQVL
jgi:hypothetical protein